MYKDSSMCNEELSGLYLKLNDVVVTRKNGKKSENEWEEILEK